MEFWAASGAVVDGEFSGRIRVYANQQEDSARIVLVGRH